MHLFSFPSFRSVNGTKPPSERETPLEPHINLSIEHFNALRGHLLGRYWLVDRAEEELRDWRVLLRFNNISPLELFCL